MMPAQTIPARVGRPTRSEAIAHDLRDEVHSLRAEAREDSWHMADPAKRLRESAIRDGRFSDFQDASALCHRIERMARRGQK